MSKAIDIINRAYTIVGTRALGESLDGELISDALGVLNSMIDSWRTEDLYVSTVAESILQLTPGQQSVTIGPGMQIDMPVPQKVEEGAFCRSSGIDYPMDIIQQIQYEQIQLKTAPSSYPSALFYNRGYPSGTIYLFPVPAGLLELHLPLAQQLIEFVDVETDYPLAPGARKAMEYSLAVELLPPGRQLSNVTIQIGANARRVLKRSNHQTPVLDMPIGIDTSGRFNILSGIG
jgi:hypothetical protein